VPLELLNAEKGIGIATTLVIKANTSALLGAVGTTGTTGMTGTTGSGTTGSTGNTGIISTTGTSGSNGTTDTTGTIGLFGTTDTTGTTSTTGGTGTTNTTAAANTATAKTTSIAIRLDGVHDLIPFEYGSTPAVLLNPHPAALDVAAAGAITGKLDLTNIATSVDSSGHVNVRVTAEARSTDGTRHVAVITAQVADDGSFVLYPLATSAGSQGSYDVVVHGPNIATVITTEASNR